MKKSVVGGVKRIRRIKTMHKEYRGGDRERQNER